MNESQFKSDVRNRWIPTVWSGLIEDKTESGWPDVMFMSPVVTLVEFKWIPKPNKNGSFIIPWKKTQPIFLLNYVQHGGNAGGLLRVASPSGFRDYWISVEVSSEWLKHIRGTIDETSPYLTLVSKKNIRHYIL